MQPDEATAAAAPQKGEADWVEEPLIDLCPMLKRSPDAHYIVWTLPLEVSACCGGSGSRGQSRVVAPFTTGCPMSLRILSRRPPNCLASQVLLTTFVMLESSAASRSPKSPNWSASALQPSISGRRIASGLERRISPHFARR